MHADQRVCARVCVRVCVCACACVCVCARAHTCACVPVCVFGGLCVVSGDSLCLTLTSYVFLDVPSLTFLESEFAYNPPYFFCHCLKCKLFLSCQLMKLEKEKQSKSKVSRKVEIR